MRSISNDTGYSLASCCRRPEGVGSAAGSSIGVGSYIGVGSGVGSSIGVGSGVGSSIGAVIAIAVSSVTCVRL